MLMALAGCISSSKSFPTASPAPSIAALSTHITNTVTPIPAQTSIRENKSEFSSTPTPLPTQNPTQSFQMNDLLHSKDCELSCYLGIIPGKTTLDEAQNILENIGAKYQGSFPSRTDNAIKYPYSMRIGLPDQSDQSQNKNGVLDTIFQGITLTSFSNIVEGVDITISTTELKDTYRNYWSMYSARELLKHYGVPDQISLEANDPQLANLYLGNRVLLIYQKIRTVIEIYGNEEDNSICSTPGFEAPFFDLHLVLIGKNSSLKLYTQGGIPPTDERVWTPIEKSLGITKEEFYSEIITNHSDCIMPKN